MSLEGGDAKALVHTKIMNFRRTTVGFTLIELMTTLAILAIVISVAVPSFVSISDKRSVNAAHKLFQSDIALARSESRLRGKPVSMCQTQAHALVQDANLSDPSKVCKKQSNQWHRGWVVFVDDGVGSGGVAFDGYQNGDEEIIKIATPKSADKIHYDFRRLDGGSIGERNNILFDDRGRPFLINSGSPINTNLRLITCIMGKESDFKIHRGFLVSKLGKIETLKERKSTGQIVMEYVKDNGTRASKNGTCN